MVRDTIRAPLIIKKQNTKRKVQTAIFPMLLQNDECEYRESQAKIMIRNTSSEREIGQEREGRTCCKLKRKKYTDARVKKLAHSYINYIKRET